jgi:hypothetical protein
MDSIMKQMKPVHMLGCVLAFFVVVWVLRAALLLLKPEYFTGTNGITYSVNCATGAIVGTNADGTAVDPSIISAANLRLTVSGSIVNTNGTILGHVDSTCQCWSIDPATAAWTAGKTVPNGLIDCTTGSIIAGTTGYTSTPSTPAAPAVVPTVPTTTTTTPVSPAAAAAAGSADATAAAAAAAAASATAAGSSTATGTTASLTGVSPAAATTDTTAAQVLLNTLKPTLTTCKNAYNISWV